MDFATADAAIPIPCSIGKKNKTIAAIILKNLRRYPNETLREKNSKKTCMNCKHYEYCDRANRCNGDCGRCDDTTCENNPNYEVNK